MIKQYIHIRNLEKYHPGYKDRNLMWAKINLTMAQGDPDFELIDNEIDKWRFISMILLELQAKKPLPDYVNYWKSKGFDLRKRPMSLTIEMLHNFLEVVTEDSKVCGIEKRRVREDKDKDKEKEEDKDKEGNFVSFVTTVVDLWNGLVDRKPILSKINEISDNRRYQLKKRYEKKSFQDFGKIIFCIEEQEFLLGQNDRKWKVSFDWLIANDTNYIKILERKYKDDKQTYKFMREK